MFADDTQIINKTEKSIEESLRILNIYEKASGAKLNLDKTVGMYLGIKAQSKLLISCSYFSGIPLISISYPIKDRTSDFRFKIFPSYVRSLDFQTSMQLFIFIYVVYQKKKGKWEWSILKFL
jgi:hypothetical protein